MSCIAFVGDQHAGPEYLVSGGGDGTVSCVGVMHLIATDRIHLGTKFCANFIKVTALSLADPSVAT